MLKMKFVARAEWAVAVLLSATVLVLLMATAAHAGALWRDECNSLQLVRMSVADLRQNFQFDSFPILFPIILRGFTDVFGTSDAALRTFGCMIGVALLAIAWWNARVLGAAPLMFPALIGLNTTFLIWGTTIRGYGLGTVSIALSVGLAAKALLRPGKKSFVALAIGWLVAVQSLYFNIALVAAIAAALIITLVLRRQLKFALITAAIAAGCALSYAPYLHMYSALDWNVVLKLPVTLMSVWERLLVACGEPAQWSPILYGALLAVALSGAIWRLVSAAGTLPRGEFDLLCFAVLTSLIAPLAFYLFLHRLGYAPKIWYYLAPFAVLGGAIDLIAVILSRLFWVRVLRLTIVIAILVTFPFAAWPKILRRHSNVDIVAQRLEQETKANDLIVVNHWSAGVSFNWYYHGATAWVTLPLITAHRSHRYDLFKAKMMEAFPLDDLQEKIAATLSSGNRVWLVGGVELLPPGKTPLSPLAAPDPQFGWRQSVYLVAWSQQLGRFIREHASQLTPVLQPTPDVHGEENLSVAVVDGWRE